jgi:hypothetical protein
MRAATVIVGAIAVSSCLIALSLVLTSGNGNTRPVARQANRMHARKTEGSSNSQTRPAGTSGPVQCSVEVTVEGGSCFLGKNVLAVYKETGAATLTAVDPETGEEVSFRCTGTAPTVCTSSTGISVYLAP